MSATDSPQVPERPDPAYEAAWRGLVKRRATVVLTVLGIWAVVIEARLVQLQVFQHDWLLARALSQQNDVVVVPAVRGDIVDRAGRMLAYSVDGANIIGDPIEVKDDAGTARTLCQLLGDCPAGEVEAIAAKFADNRRWFLIRKARTVSPQQLAAVAAAIDGRRLRGVSLRTETLRYYPKTDLAAHLLGYVGAENRGLGGLEAKLDHIIRGRDGSVLVQNDARNQQMLSRVEQAPTAGATIELTIDQTLQHIAERELAAGIAANRARAGTAIIMDPQTGEVLALANSPTFNPNTFGRASDEDRSNRAVVELYEPGSTFKIVTASAAIEEGVLNTSDLIDCSPGYITFPGRKPIRDVHRYGVLSFEDVVVKSSNVGAIKAGLRVGAERLGRYVRRFGFGERIAPDFAGESRGIVHPSSGLTDSDLASMSMGYAVGVTPIQMAAAVSAVANGGTLMEPHIIRATVVNGVRQPAAPRAVRRAITPETAAVLTTIMEQVVVRGTARAAALTRYQVAGKTGTAAKIIDGRYSDTLYNASFIGFVPSRRPAFAIVVMIDSPTAGRMYGGDVAAPVFKRIAEAALRQMGIAPTVNSVPPVVIASTADGPAVYPAVATAPMPTLTYLGGRTLMPDVRGMSGRDALRVLGTVGLQVRMSGQGVVSTQTPEPGEPVDAGNWSVLQLQRVPPPPAAGGVR